MVSLFACCAAGLCLIFLLASVSLFVDRQDDKRKLRDANTTISNITAQANGVLKWGQDRQRFLNDVHWHMARFLTNDHIRDLELAPNRISTFNDTNFSYAKVFTVTVTDTNIMATKAPTGWRALYGTNSPKENP